MSMIYTFCAICRRIGIQAAPTNTPRKVLCHITSPDPHSGNILLDVCTTDRPVVFSSTDLTIMLREAELPEGFPADAVTPASLPTLLARVINNIFASMAGLADLDLYALPPGHTPFRAEYAVTMMFAAVNAGQMHFVPKIPDDCPLDEQVVLLSGLLPQIRSENQRMRFVHDLASSVHGNLKYEVLREPRRRPADLRGHAFVGRVFSTRGEHEWFVGYVIVVGWMVRECAVCGESCILTGHTQLDRHSDLRYTVLTDQGFQRACTSESLRPGSVVLTSLQMYMTSGGLLSR